MIAETNNGDWYMVLIKPDAKGEGVHGVQVPPPPIFEKSVNYFNFMQKIGNWLHESYPHLVTCKFLALEWGGRCIFWPFLGGDILSLKLATGFEFYYFWIGDR